jgi:uncharacterized membrane protein
MFWENTTLVVTLPMFLTYFCRLSKRKIIKLLPMLLSAVIMVGALITYMLFPALAVLSLSIGWAGLVALASSALALFISQQVDKVQNSFNK